MKPLRSYGAFIDIMKNLEHPIKGILAGAVFTAVVQSSSATTSVIIVLAEQGFLSLEAGIPVIFGANVGTCVTAGLASIGAEREAKRVALAHVLFKVAGVLLFVFWIPAFSELIRAIALKFGSGVGRQIANAHTIFNVSVGFLFIPLTPLFARLVKYLLPLEKMRPEEALKANYLDENLISTPALAIDLAHTEISRMAKILSRMLKSIIIPFVSDEAHIRKGERDYSEKTLLIHEIPSRDEFMPDLTLLEALDVREEKIDFLEHKLSDYLMRIARGNITDAEAEEIFGMSSIVKDMESIGDLIHRNMVPLIARKKDLKYDFSEEGKEELMIYQSKVIKQLNLLREAILEKNPDLASKIMFKERKYLDLELQYRAKHLKRIVLKNEQSMGTHRVHMELMDLMKQVVVYSSNIAKTYISTCQDRSN